MSARRSWTTALGAALAVLVLGGVAARTTALCASPGRAPDLTLSPAATADQSPMIIGVAVHREFVGFDAARSDDLVRRLGFTSVRDEIGQSSGNAPGGLVRSLRLGGALSSPAQSSNNANLFIVSGGGSRQFKNGIPLIAGERDSYYRFLAGLGPQMGASRPMLEIWNEWNLPTRLRKGGSAQSYSTLVDGAIPVLRKAFPGSPILAGAIGNDFARGIGPNTYWQWTRDYLAGGSWKAADGLSVHVYANCMSGIERQPVALVQRLMALDQMTRTANAGRSFPVYVTEVGWPEQRGACGFDQAERTAFPAQFLLMAEAMPFIRGVWFYELRDGSGDRSDMENTFGFATSDYRIKPTACALAQTIALLKDYRVRGVQIADGVATATLRAPSGEIRLAWSADGSTHRLAIPDGMHARALCAPRDSAAGAVDLTILPQIIYAGSLPVAAGLQ